MKIIEITWLDSKGITSEWEHKEDIKPLKPCLVTSVGYLLEDMKEYKTIVQSEGEEQLLGRMTIPKSCIVKTTIFTAMK